MIPFFLEFYVLQKHRSGVEMRSMNLLKFQLRLKKPVLVDGILCLNI